MTDQTKILTANAEYIKDKLSIYIMDDESHKSNNNEVNLIKYIMIIIFFIIIGILAYVLIDGMIEISINYENFMKSMRNG